MTGRRKGTPCACSTDPCSCGSSKGKCIRAINNVSPDPNGDFNIKGGTGIAISNGPDNEITIINSANPNAFVEGDNIDLIPSGDDIEIALTQDPVINGTLTVNGDIIQNGAAYETHAEHIYTADDYIIMRDGAISALSAGDYSGFQVKLYDGVNDGRLVIDNAGVARVGDVGDEQPLLTRSESGQLNNGDLLQWNGTSQKAVSAGVNTSQIVRGSGNIGSDTKPIKVVNGVATPVSKNLEVNELTITNGVITNTTVFELQSPNEPIRIYHNGKLISVSLSLRVKNVAEANITYADLLIGTGYPPSPTNLYPEICAVTSVDGGSTNPPLLFVDRDGNLKLHIRSDPIKNKIFLGSVTYISI